eukprot:1160142-Pelagomonas_calceolata.AAC.32
MAHICRISTHRYQRAWGKEPQESRGTEVEGNGERGAGGDAGEFRWGCKLARTSSILLCLAV